MENHIEKNLNFLLDLQKLDTRIYEIAEAKGELPQQVKALTDRLADYDSQVVDYQAEKKRFEQHIVSLRVKLTDIQSLIKRLESQQQNIRNNREYDAMTKEIRLNELDIQLAEKEIREYNLLLEDNRKKMLQLDQPILETRQYLLEKQQEMEAILSDNKEEAVLQKKYKAIASNLDPILLQLYQRIKQRVSNNLAVVKVKRGACGGCFTAVYPQMQAEIKEKLQMFRCENCGRILADVAEAVTIIAPIEEEEILA
jgi:predicted  nucleic acid-binding Zn-ribbon protein